MAIEFKQAGALRLATGVNSVGNVGLDAGSNVVGKTQITDGSREVDVHLGAGNWLEVKSRHHDQCWAGDFAGAQTDKVILTPLAGKKLLIIQVYASTAVNNVDVTLKFETSNNIFFKLYAAQKGAQAGSEICATGAVDEAVELTCGAGTFVSISYDNI